MDHVNIHIEELVLDGLPRPDDDAVAAAIRTRVGTAPGGDLPDDVARSIGRAVGAWLDGGDAARAPHST
jgi:hypothetical protein